MAGFWVRLRRKLATLTVVNVNYSKSWSICSIVRKTKGKSYSTVSQRIW